MGYLTLYFCDFFSNPMILHKNLVGINNVSEIHRKGHKNVPIKKLIKKLSVKQLIETFE